MKLLLNTLFLFSSMLGLTLGQSVEIGFPPPETKVHRGQNLTVEIDRPNSLLSSFEIGIAIGIASCASSPCQPPEAIMGQILFSGAFNPQFHPPPGKPPYENFTVQIPLDFQKGPAQLNIAHAAVFGAGPSPNLQTLNESLFVI